MNNNTTQNVLIVDDEKSNIDIFIGLFEEINKNDKYNIITAISAKSALKIIDKRKIDLILLDIMIPEMDGFEICKIIKSKEETKNIPIVFITSKDDEESIEKGFEVGGADYITKPFKPKELIARIKNQLHLKELKDKEIEYNKNIALNELIHNIAHHWRQPLSVIAGAADGMSMLKEMDSLDDKKFYEDCNTISETTQYLSSIIENFTNLNENCNNNKIEKFSIKEFVEENYNLLFLDCKDIEIVQNIDTEIFITNSLNQIFQVFISIIKNSKEAITDTNCENKIICLDIKEKENNILIQIYDSAGGIKKENLTKVFEPYFTTKHKYQDKGLGLYSVKKIVTQTLKGSISIDNYSFKHNNKEQFGARVNITLPKE
jgi:CheY-like chemotaxis protein